MATIHMPFIADLMPVMRYPTISWFRRLPMAWVPNVASTFPKPNSSNPEVAFNWRHTYNFNLGRWWRNICNDWSWCNLRINNVGMIVIWGRCNNTSGY